MQAQPIIRRESAWQVLQDEVMVGETPLRLTVTVRADAARQQVQPVCKRWRNVMIGASRKYQIGLLQGLFKLGQEGGGGGTVHDAVVEGQAQVHHGADGGQAAHGDDGVNDGADA